MEWAAGQLAACYIGANGKNASFFTVTMENRKRLWYNTFHESHQKVDWIE